jgi:hypothetical protein
MKFAYIFFFVINDTLVYKMFTSVSFIAILRHCNQAAHVLAAFAKEKVGVSVWFDECPPFLFSILYLMKLYLSFLIKKKKKKLLYRPQSTVHHLGGLVT